MRGVVSTLITYAVYQTAGTTEDTKIFEANECTSRHFMAQYFDTSTYGRYFVELALTYWLEPSSPAKTSGKDEYHSKLLMYSASTCSSMLPGVIKSSANLSN